MCTTYIEISIINKFPISICLFDIDHFKHYNDTNGHPEGDRLLKELGSLITRLSRKTSVIARYGGEEFIVLLPNMSKEDACVYAGRLQLGVAAHPFMHGERQPLGCISVSGGIASFPEDGTSLEKVIEMADKALYRVKQKGGNRVIKHVRSAEALRVPKGNPAPAGA